MRCSCRCLQGKNTNQRNGKCLVSYLLSCETLCWEVGLLSHAQQTLCYKGLNITQHVYCTTKVATIRYKWVSMAAGQRTSQQHHKVSIYTSDLVEIMTHAFLRGPSVSAERSSSHCRRPSICWGTSSLPVVTIFTYAYHIWEHPTFLTQTLDVTITSL